MGAQVLVVKKGIFKWSIKDDDGKVHIIMLPDIMYALQRLLLDCLRHSTGVNKLMITVHYPGDPGVPCTKTPSGYSGVREVH